MFLIRIVILGFIFMLNPLQAETKFDSPQAMQDALLESKIIANLISEPFIDTSEFDIHISENNVTLKGYIPSEAHRYIILEWISKHDSVKHIYDELSIQKKNKADLADPSPNQQEPVEAIQDAFILSEIRAKLFASRIIKSEDIAVDVVEGIVYLAGVIPNIEQKTILLTTLEQMPGVKAVDTRQLLTQNS